MPVKAVVGAQWGDEGKGKIVDLLASDADIVVRFGGGSNAGHTVVNKFGTFRLHSLPSGVFHAGVLNVVGTGTVVDFESLLAELGQLRDAGVPNPNILISERAHVIMPYHKLEDRVSEERLGAHRIGTTGQGVGPAYVDKVSRTGIQAGEILDPERLEAKLRWIIELKRAKLNGRPDEALDLDRLMDSVRSWNEHLGATIGDGFWAIRGALDAEERILLEGQLGVMRDLDWGTYPFVTSSTTLAAGAGAGAPVPPWAIREIVAVVKAYTSAVGEGPLPTELRGAEAEVLRAKGKEYGATTGRPRRVGWLDGCALRYATTLMGATAIAITKLDVLDGMDRIRIGVAYETRGEVVDSVPHPALLEETKTVYEEVPGWHESTAGAVRWSDLPANARRYVERISEIAQSPVAMIGTGQSRDDIVVLPEAVLSTV